MTRQKTDNLRYYLGITARGIAMGAADVVPGVSGGTIAFITGIYEKLLLSIKSIDLEAIKLLFTGQFEAFWSRINGTFLLALGVGIIASFLTLANAITFALAYYPMYIWSFFLGLIIASVFLMGKSVSRWNLPAIALFIAGAAIAYWITVVSPASAPKAYWYIFLSGFLGIMAMILPGISGSFILLLMGSYHYMMEALKNFEVVSIGVFIVGVVCGLACFSRALTWLLKRHHNLAVSLLTGFMLGSINKVWPWQNAVEWVTDQKGVQSVSMYKSVLPWNYDGNADVWIVAALAVAGFILIYAIEKAASKLGNK